MSYGLRTWSTEGALTLDTTTFTYQVLGSWVLDFSNSYASGFGGSLVNYTLSIPGYDPANCALILLPTRESDIPSVSEGYNNIKSYPYVTTSVGQATIKALNPSASQSNTVSPRGIFRAMAIKYK